MLRAALLALFFATGVLACGDGDGDTQPEIDAATVPQSFVVSDQSGEHSFELLCDDLLGTGSRSYLADGDHEHVVLLSADELMRINAGEKVTTSFVEGHEHVFVVELPVDACR